MFKSLNEWSSASCEQADDAEQPQPQEQSSTQDLEKQSFSRSRSPTDERARKEAEERFGPKWSKSKSKPDDELKDGEDCKPPESNVDPHVSEKKEEVTLEELTTVLEEWPAFGLFSLLCVHPTAGLRTVAFKLITFLLLGVQLVLPVALFITKYNQHDGGFCPKSATASERVVFASISCLYLVRSAENMLKNLTHLFAEHFESVKKMVPPQSREIFERRKKSGVTSSVLFLYGQVDQIMDVGYDAVLFLFNLWLVFIESDPMDMVMNCLALELFTKLDDQFMEDYFKYNARAVPAIFEQKLHRKGYGKANWMLKAFAAPAGFLTMLMCMVSMLVPVIAFGMVFFGSWCK